jgi:hypothetical protein
MSNNGTTACFGQTVNLQTQAVPHCIYKWYKDGSPITYQSYNINCACYVTVYTYGYTYGATASGSYSAEIIDTLTGCSSMTNAISVTIYSLPTASIVQNNFLQCNGNSNASLTVSASGTVSPYTYQWSNSFSNATINNLIAGNYSVIATDAHGCTTTSSYTITQPDVVGGYITSPTNTRGYQISCYGYNDGSATIQPTGGTAPYTYLWSTGATTQTISNLVAGSYSVTIYDANGCTPGTASFTLTQPPALNVTLTPVLHYGGHAITCYGGSDGVIQTTVTGGTANMTYLWSNNQTTSYASQLSEGTYTVQVTDSVGCITSASATVTQPSALTAQKILSDYTGYGVSCFGMSDGSIQIVPTGGIAPYHISWTDTSNLLNRTGLSSGTYIHTLYDTLGCALHDTITVTSPDSIGITTSGSVLNCYGDANGTASAVVSGGNAPYTYSWQGGATTATATGLTANTYLVTVTDTRGCTQVAQATVSQPAAVQGYSFGTFIGCGTQIGLLSVTSTGGTAPYTYLWSNGSTAEFQTNQPVGNYSVVITDSHGCLDTSYAVILSPPTLTATMNNFISPCTAVDTTPVATLTVNVTGGVAPYMYLWSNGETTSTVQNLVSGNYSCIVTDANGCTVMAQALAANNDPAVISGDTLICNETMATLTANAGTSYSWSNGFSTFSTQQQVNVGPGNFTLTMANLAGCTHTATAHVVSQACYSPVQVRFLYQGYFDGSNGMQPVMYNQGEGVNTSVTDTVLLELHSAIPPYQTILSQATTVSIGGTAFVNFPPVTLNAYLVVKHRSGLETWSANPLAITTSLANYDFTTSASQAYGNNQIEVYPGLWAFYIGDINQDATIDAFDYILLDNDLVIGAYGYLPTDLNGDGVTDAFDYLLIDGNVTAGVGVAAP